VCVCRAMALSVAALAAGACPDLQSTATYPPADVYGVPVSFVGEWLGEVGGVEGTLRVSELGRARFYGQFRADDGAIQYSFKMEQRLENDQPTNLVELSWQDGRGDLGLGWLLINREDSALTGSLGRGESRTVGLGELTFIRLE
jgi:hypothetical protein